jgi:uncharacterized protein YceK
MWKGFKMKKRSDHLLVLIVLVGSVLSACQSSPTSTTESIAGTWVGRSQWLCSNDDPAWSTTIEFKTDGTFTAIMDLPMSNAPHPQSVGNGTWSLSESNIEMKFSTTTWTGKVSDNKMEGSLADDGTSCDGKWFLNKQ